MKTVPRSRAFAALVLAIVAIVGGGAALFACSTTPQSVPIRTFERAQRMDVVCLRVVGDDAPAPLPQEECAPVPPNVNGGGLQNQLFALVTQSSRGEVAVVDLSAGLIIDQSRAVPGINFLPVGALPTDVTATPDGRMIFVASAEPNKFAIYGIPGHRILGDAASRRDPEGATTLTSWPVCALPQRPGSLTVVPRRPAPFHVDAGQEAGSADAGASQNAELPYELVAVLPGDRVHPAKVVTIDPRPFINGSPRRLPDGTLDVLQGGGVPLTPGTLTDCPITAAMALADETAVPAAVFEGARWDDGVSWVDGGVDLTCSRPEKAARCGLRPCKCDVGTDAGAEPTSGLACDPDGGARDVPVEVPLDLGPLDPPQPVAIARDDQMLYVADDGIPLVHVVDLSTPGTPRELPPFVVSSLTDPSRTVSIRDIAISPPTREYKRFLYAVDRKQGSIAVFDVTDPMNADRSPMRRPHPELNPFQPPDRLTFSAPVVSVAFARHDVPLAKVNEIPVNPAAGVLCNPNPNLDPASLNPADFGVYYRANSTDITPALVPGRLRGVFAFATLTNGQVVAIDVDDWDAPCRRPASLTGAASDLGVGDGAGALAVAQPVPGPGDRDPYHAPNAASASVTDEIFFPVSSPHRLRSTFLLKDDTVTGKHIPFLTSTPSIVSTDRPLALFGEASGETPRLRRTALRSGDTDGADDIGVRFSLDTPEVHFDQDWSVTYEGAIPGFEGLPATLSTADGYASLVMSQPQAHFCTKGVEDTSIGSERAAAITNALAAARRNVSAERLDRRLFDYVQVTDELLPSDDAFWTQADLPEPDSCWDPRILPGPARHDYCASWFGSFSQQSDKRDFPILEAYDDHLVIGRFATIPPNKTAEVIYSDPSNAADLKRMRCCFHHQVRFNVRAASQWVAVGSSVGLLSHLTRGEGDRCVPTCDPRDALLNGRAPSLPYTKDALAPTRDSVLAMRNPAFSFFVQNGQKDGVDEIPKRDTSYRFQTRGAFQPLSINLAAGTTAVNPQSMRFIESLGQIAVVDGASQGLVLIDLASVAIARAPYF